MKKRLKELFKKSRYTADEKNEIRGYAEQMNIEVRIDGKCQNCWHDLVCEIYNAMVKESGDGWFVPQYAEGIRVNDVVLTEANMTVETAEWLRGLGLGKYLRDEVPADEQHEAE